VNFLICRVRDGCLDVGPNYGLELARLGDFPSDITMEAKRVANLLADKETERRLASTSSKVVARRKTLTAVRLTKLEETNGSVTEPFLARFSIETGASSFCPPSRGPGEVPAQDAKRCSRSPG